MERCSVLRSGPSPQRTSQLNEGEAGCGMHDPREKGDTELHLGAPVRHGGAQCIPNPRQGTPGASSPVLSSCLGPRPVLPALHRALPQRCPAGSLLPGKPLAAGQRWPGELLTHGLLSKSWSAVAKGSAGVCILCMQAWERLLGARRAAAWPCLELGLALSGSQTSRSRPARWSPQRRC